MTNLTPHTTRLDYALREHGTTHAPLIRIAAILGAAERWDADTFEAVAAAVDAALAPTKAPSVGTSDTDHHAFWERIAAEQHLL